MATDGPGPVPDWFRSAVVGGLQYLYALRLAGTPAADTIEATGRAWIRALWRLPVGWEPDADSPRLEAAFDLLAQTRTDWPAPRHLREAMPPRPQLTALPAPDLSPEEVRANLARLRAALADTAAVRRLG